MLQRMMGGMLAIALLASLLPIPVLAEETVGAPSESETCAHGNTGSCTSCDAIAAVQSEIETLPTVEAMLAMDNGGRNVVYNTLLDVTNAYERLPSGDQSLVSNLDVMTALHGAFTQLVAPASSNTVAIDETAFPDPVFRAHVESTFDTDGDGFLGYEEYGKITDIHMDQMGIASLAGIEYFPNLKTLCCSGNQLTQLDVSRNPALEALWCGENQLTQLDVSQNPALEELECTRNQLAQLDVSQNPALWLLYCDSNQLAELEVCNNPALSRLSCGTNHLTQLDVSNNPALLSLYCNGNQLTSLDLSQNPYLKEQYTYANSYAIETNGHKFDLSTLPGNFDVSKTSNWTGGSVNETLLTVEEGVTAVSYTYNGSSVFTLTVSETGGKWPNTYGVSFDSNGGTTADTVVRVPKYSKYEIEFQAPPTREGYHFLGWSADKNATAPEYTEGKNGPVKVDGDLVFYAVWEPEEPRSILTLDANDGTASQQILPVATGRDFKMTSALSPAREGYAFAGWSVDPDSRTPTVEVDDIIDPEADMTLYAIWRFVGESSGKSPEPSEAQSIHTGNECAEHTYTRASGDVCTVCGQKYEPVEEAYPKVIKATQEGTELLDTPSVEDGKVIKVLHKGDEVLLSHRLTDIIGNVWYVSADGGYISGEGLTEVTEKIALVFDANGGTGGPKSTAKIPNEKINPPKAEPTREGYLFKGWAYRKDATYPEWIYDDIKKGKEITLEDNTILYAVWAKPNEPGPVDYITQDKLNKTTGFPQVEGLYPNKGKSTGLCTSSAIALLIKRKQVIDGYEGSPFDFTDVRMSLGLYENLGVDHYFNAGVKFEEGTEQDMWRRTFDGFWTQPIGFTNLHSEEEETHRTTYYTAGKLTKDLGRNTKEREASIIELLKEHPEGVVIYSKYGTAYNKSGTPYDLCHAIVLTGYDETEGFYACDSVNVRDAYIEAPTAYTKSKTQTKLEETWLNTVIKNRIFANLRNCGYAGCVWYIESVSYPNP